VIGYDSIYVPFLPPILEPILVMPYDGNYKLLCGERRFFAAYELGMESVPARLVNGVTQREEILAYQLTENMLREDRNPACLFSEHGEREGEAPCGFAAGGGDASPGN
jgi:hypothetical protein